MILEWKADPGGPGTSRPDVAAGAAGPRIAVLSRAQPPRAPPGPSRGGPVRAWRRDERGGDRLAGDPAGTRVNPRALGRRGRRRLLAAGRRRGGGLAPLAARPRRCGAGARERRDAGGGARPRRLPGHRPPARSRRLREPARRVVAAE